MAGVSEEAFILFLLRYVVVVCVTFVMPSILSVSRSGTFNHLVYIHMCRKINHEFEQDHNPSKTNICAIRLAIFFFCRMKSGFAVSSIPSDFHKVSRQCSTKI